MEQETTSQSAAIKVAGGIFASRILGLMREGSIAYFFGVGPHADVLQTAFRGPNLLQNLLGEGTISAAFIPLYSKMLAEGRAEEAGRFAGAIFGLLLALAGGLCLLGFVFAKPIVSVLTPGWVNDAALVASGELAINRFDLAVKAVRIIFPMTGILVLSAWALGILNSHRRFFLPYFAPVFWNASIIAALFAGAQWLIGEPRGDISDSGLNRLLLTACFGALFGGALQFLVQLPLVIRLLKGFRFSFSLKAPGVRQALRAFGPVVGGRGVAQVSAYLDLLLGSFLAAGALSALRYALTLFILPISLFGMSVAASELPELSRIEQADLKTFMERLNRSLRQIMFLVVPTFVGYLALGYLLVGVLYQRGNFGVNNNWLVYAVLAGYTFGLLATTASRLLQNACYALHDTKTPAKIAVLRVVVSAALAVPLMFFLDQFSIAGTVGTAPQPSPLYFGAVGLALGSALGAWVELWRLSAFLHHRLENFSLPWGQIGKMLGLALLALVPALGLWYVLPAWHIALQALLVVGTYGVTYLILAHVFDITEMEAWLGQVLRRFR